jgi:hypothetical protein
MPTTSIALSSVGFALNGDRFFGSAAHNSKLNAVKSVALATRIPTLCPESRRVVIWISTNVSSVFECLSASVQLPAFCAKAFCWVELASPDGRLCKQAPGVPDRL